MKRALAGGPAQAVAAWLVALYVRLVWATSRIEDWDRAELDAALGAGRPVLLVFWHGRILMMARAWQRPERVQMMISSHRDGRLISRAVLRFGIDTIAGSSNRDPLDALRQLVRRLAAGQICAVTPDGPRGPRMRAKAGVATAARRVGALVVPVAFSTTRGRFLNSWDRFLVPFPFGRIALRYGQALDLSGLDQEAARRAIEDGLNQATAEADMLCGRADRPSPAPPPAAAEAADASA